MPVCLSVGEVILYDVTSYLDARPHVPFLEGGGGFFVSSPMSLGVGWGWGFCLGVSVLGVFVAFWYGLMVQSFVMAFYWGLLVYLPQTSSGGYQSEQYVSYWNHSCFYM